MGCVIVCYLAFAFFYFFLHSLLFSLAIFLLSLSLPPPIFSLSFCLFRNVKKSLFLWRPHIIVKYSSHFLLLSLGALWFFCCVVAVEYLFVFIIFAKSAHSPYTGNVYEMRICEHNAHTHTHTHSFAHIILLKFQFIVVPGQEHSNKRQQQQQRRWQRWRRLRVQFNPIILCIYEIYIVAGRYLSHKSWRQPPLYHS